MLGLLTSAVNETHCNENRFCLLQSVRNLELLANNSIDMAGSNQEDFTSLFDQLGQSLAEALIKFPRSKILSLAEEVLRMTQLSQKVRVYIVNIMPW